VGRRKAGRAATDLVNGLHADSQAARLENREATFDPCKCLAVFSGQQCVGHLLRRGKLGVEAFDADDKSLGIFPDQRSAANALTKAVTS
jgi:hypothetical protein